MYREYDQAETDYRKCLEDAITSLDDRKSDASVIVEALPHRCGLARFLFIDAIKNRLAFEADDEGRLIPEAKLAADGWDKAEELTREWRSELIAKVLEERVGAK